MYNILKSHPWDQINLEGFAVVRVVITHCKSLTVLLFTTLDIRMRIFVCSQDCIRECSQQTNNPPSFFSLLVFGAFSQGGICTSILLHTSTIINVYVLVISNIFTIKLITKTPIMNIIVIRLIGIHRYLLIYLIQYKLISVFWPIEII